MNVANQSLRNNKEFLLTEDGSSENGSNKNFRLLAESLSKWLFRRQQLSIK